MADSDNHSGGGENNGSNDNDPHRFLPIANVSRIMKKALPANARISKEAKEAVQECVSEFISFITGEASDKCMHDKRKTVNGDDLLWAMSTLGFDNYINSLQLYLLKFRELEGDEQGIGTGAPGNGGSAPSSSSQPTDVLGGGGNVNGSYGAILYGTGTDGAGSSGSGMMPMAFMYQQLYGGARGDSGFASSSISSQPTGVRGGGGNVGSSYAGANLYGTGTDNAGSDGSGMMTMGQELYDVSPTSGPPYQHQQHQLGSSLSRGNSGTGSRSGSDGNYPPSERGKDKI